MKEEKNKQQNLEQNKRNTAQQNFEGLSRLSSFYNARNNNSQNYVNHNNKKEEESPIEKNQEQAQRLNELDAIDREKEQKASQKSKKKKKTKEAKKILEENPIIKAKLRKIKIIGILIVVGLIVIIIIFLALITPGGSEITAVQWNRKAMYETGIIEEKDYEDYEKYWTDIDIEKLNEKNQRFYDRFNNIYGYYSAHHSTLNSNVLNATKLHVLSTLFLDHTPSTFVENIEEADDTYGEKHGYYICDPENEIYTDESICGNPSKLTTNWDYSVDGILKLAAYEGEGWRTYYEKYEHERDSIRSVVRHFFNYTGHCALTKKVWESRPCTEADKPRTENCGDWITYHCGAVYEPKTFWQILMIVKTQVLNSAGEKNYRVYPDRENCLVTMQKFSCGRENWDTARFWFTEDINYCDYYGWFLTNNYYDEHPHFKQEFNNVLTKYKGSREKITDLRFIKEKAIVSIVDQSDEEHDKVYSYSSLGSISNYTLSNDIIISVEAREDGREAAGIYPLDQYVEGVLNGEVGVLLSKIGQKGVTREHVMQAMKANAVAVRSYVLSRTKGGTRSIGNSSATQNFSSSCMYDFASERCLFLRQATMETAGQILTLNGNYFSAEYDSFCRETGTKENGTGNYKCYTKDNQLYCSAIYLRKGKYSNCYEAADACHTIETYGDWGLAGGHCRGMSQWASVSYASRENMTYVDLIKFFYSADFVFFDYATKQITGYVGGAENSNIGTKKEKKLTCTYIINEKQYILEIPYRVTGMSLSGFYGEDASSPCYMNASWVENDVVANALQFVGDNGLYMDGCITGIYDNSKDITAQDAWSDWCAMFVGYIFAKTPNSGIFLDNSGKPFQSGGVEKWRSTLKNKGMYFTKEEVLALKGIQRGDIVLFDHIDLDKYSNHIGIVESFDSVSGTICYVDGNTGGTYKSAYPIQASTSVKSQCRKYNHPSIDGYGVYNR